MGLLRNFGTSLTLLLAHLSLCLAHREHKVHNIVLYPDKESWCKTTPIKQVVTWPQCAPQELDNNVCVGACFSYMVPHSEPSAPGDLIRPYCDSCQPLDSIWHTVSLDCKDKDDNPTTMQKKVQIITNCSCSSCMESSRIKPDFNNLLQSLELESARVQQQQQQQHHHHQYHQESSESDGLATEAPIEPQLPAAGAGESAATTAPWLLAGGSSTERQPVHEAPDLLLNPNINASSKPWSSGAPQGDDRIFQLIKQWKQPGLGEDKLEKLKSLETLKKMAAAENPEAEEFLAKLTELIHKIHSQDEQSALDPLNSDDDDLVPREDQLLQLRPTSSAAPPASLPEVPKDEDDEEVPSLQDQQLRVAASLLHRTGPHHSMVLDSGVKKIDVESHYLHPALAGQEISYQDNGLMDKTKKKDF